MNFLRLIGDTLLLVVCVQLFRMELQHRLVIFRQVAFRILITITKTIVSILCCDVDVVKTRMQTDPERYTKGVIHAAREIVTEDGVGYLLAGLGTDVCMLFMIARICCCCCHY